MKLGVDIKPTFRFTYMKCIDKRKGRSSLGELFSPISGEVRMDRQLDTGQTESDAYEPTVQFAQVGSKMKNKMSF